MTFLNFVLLGGTAAMFAPLVIHLLNRSRFRMLPWGAMHLLESAVKINSRRVQWRAWLLLALRMAIPLLLALCMARPVLTAWKTLSGGNASSMVLVIDNSLSMEAGAQRSATARRTNDRAAFPTKDATQKDSVFTAAIEEAQQVIQQAGPTTEISVYSSGGGPVNQASGASFDAKRALQRVQAIDVGAGSSPWVEVLAEGLAQLERSKELRRHLVVFSDFQKNEWEGLSAEAFSSLIPKANDGDRQTSITLVPIAPKNRENLSIHIDRPAGANVVAVGQALEVRATIKNHGQSKVAAVPVTFFVDDVALASKTVDVAAQSQVFLAFKCQLDRVGSHLIELKIDERSARSATGEGVDSIVVTDDTSFWAVEVLPPIEAILVDEPSEKRRGMSDSTFLNFALSPYAVSIAAASLDETTAGLAEATAGVDPIRCRSLEPKELSDRELSSAQVLAMANITRLDTPIAERVSKFVDEGGTLLLFPGKEFDKEWYNQTWGPSSPNPLLPAQYAAIHNPSSKDNELGKLQLETFNHPGLALFNRSSNGRLDSVDFKTWYQLKLPEASESRDNSKTRVTTLLTMDNGDPVLVENRYGKGRVLQWATSCGDRWSNLPLREVFVPVMQQLVMSTVTSSSARLNTLTGETLVVTAEAPKKSASSSTSSPKPRPEASKEVAQKVNQKAGQEAEREWAVEITTPRDQKIRLELVDSDGSRSATFSRTQFPGPYVARGNRPQLMVFAVSAAEAESDLSALDDEGIRRLAERLGADVRATATDFWQAERVKQTGREVFRWLLLGLVICLFLELLLQQSLTRVTP